MGKVHFLGLELLMGFILPTGSDILQVERPNHWTLSRVRNTYLKSYIFAGFFIIIIFLN
jgi:hypothetical protein